MPINAAARAKALANSRPLCLHRWSDFPETDRAVELVFDRICKKKPGIQPGHKIPLKVVILDLFAAWVHDPRRYLGYSRDAGFYVAASRYNSHRIGYCRLMYVIDALMELKFITSEPGYWDRTKKEGRRSRMRANRKLIRLLKDKAGLKPEMIGRAPGEEVIILRNQKKEDIDYPETAETKNLRAHVRLINQLLASVKINLHLPDDEMRKLAKRLNRDHDKYPVDFSRTRLRRIFNNRSFRPGGRFYGGWWQEIPSEYREFIEINDKRTKEIDFGGFHPRLLYARQAINYLGDPYEIPVPGLPAGDNTRKLVKVALNILLNAPNQPKAVGAIRDKYPWYSKRKVEGIIAAIKVAHQPIERYLHTGIGLDLQRLDSDLIQDIMLTTARNYKVMVLPVHDSLIVRTNFDDELSAVMEECYQRAVHSLALKPDLRDESDERPAKHSRATPSDDWLKWHETHKQYHERERWLRKRAEAGYPVTHWPSLIDTITKQTRVAVTT